MNDFLQKLFQWYADNARDFPFRRTKDPYLIWLSEIIMQQTRIGQGVPYYNKFVEAFPTVNDLAVAGQDEVLKQWQGLGYYARARNLHTTAKEVVVKYGGTFPETYEELRALKGIGDYTAAAIASVCYGLPHPVMDGNVIRFITRHFGITGSIDTARTKKKILKMLQRLMEDREEDYFTISPSHHLTISPFSGTFNQAMIEFGAMYCTPRNPDCPKCIFKSSCYASEHGMAGQLPKKKQPQVLRSRYFHYLVIQIRGKKGFYFRKREGDDIWKGLYEFPLIETSRALSLKTLMKSREWEQLFSQVTIKVKPGTRAVTHLLSHQKIITRFYNVEISGPVSWPGDFIPQSEINKLPVPRLIERYLNSHPFLS
jgi:A/G-specific adenine glycosylase